MILAVLSGGAASTISLAPMILLIRDADFLPDARVGGSMPITNAIGDRIGNSGKSESNCLSSLCFVAIHLNNALHEANRFGRPLHIGLVLD